MAGSRDESPSRVRQASTSSGSTATGMLRLICSSTSWITLVASAWALREGSPEAGGLPFVYLLKTLIPLAAALLILQGLSQALASLGTLTGVERDDE